MKARLTRDLATKLTVFIVAMVGLFAYWKYLNTGPAKHDANCMSEMKQLGIATSMYGLDNEEAFPPYYTFESDQARDKYIACTKPYTKNPKIYFCGQDSFPNKGLAFSAGMEGDPAAMSFVHPQSLKGHIPSYSTGKRVVHTSEIQNPVATPYLRDPIRGYGKDEKRDPQITGFLSPHGGLFTICFFDIHVKRVAMNINTDL